MPDTPRIAELEGLVDIVATGLFANSVAPGRDPRELWATSATEDCRAAFRLEARHLLLAASPPPAALGVEEVARGHDDPELLPGIYSAEITTKGGAVSINGPVIGTRPSPEVATAPSVSGMRVKPLEWRECSLSGVELADSAAGRYTVLLGLEMLPVRPVRAAWIDPRGRERQAATLADAKAAAQADYEARIRASLASEATTVAGETKGEPVAYVDQSGPMLDIRWTDTDTALDLADGTALYLAQSAPADALKAAVEAPGITAETVKMVCREIGLALFDELVDLGVDPDIVAQAADNAADKSKRFTGSQGVYIPRLGEVSLQARVATATAPIFAGDPTDIVERRDRFVEEANEVGQSFGMTREQAHELVDYTYDRPIGDPSKEIGAAIVTLAGLAIVAGQDLMACAEADLESLRQPETIARIRAKRATRHGRGPLPGITPPADEPQP